MLTSQITTTANTRALHPFVVESGLGSEGLYVGKDTNGGDFFFDEWVLYRLGLIHDLNSTVLGDIGAGKSSYLLTKIARNLMVGRWARVLDPKGDYRKLVAVWNAIEERSGREQYATLLSLAPGGGTKINPVDPRISRSDRQTLVVSIANAVLSNQRGTTLTPKEIKACEIGLDRINDQRVHTLPALVEAIIRPRREDAERWNMTEEELRIAGQNPGFALDHLCSGPLHGMFDSETSSSVSLNAPLVVLDLYEARKSKAMGILMLIADTFLQAFPPQGPGLVVLDEGHEIFKDVSILQGLSSDWKFCRMGAGTAHVFAAHGSQTLKAAGPAGSHQVELVRTLLADSSTRILYHIEATQTEEIRTMLGLTYRESQEVGLLNVGQSLHKVAGQRSFLVEHRILPHEWQFIDPTSQIR